jgi:hypothetical protein
VDAATLVNLEHQKTLNCEVTVMYKIAMNLIIVYYLTMLKNSPSRTYKNCQHFAKNFEMQHIFEKVTGGWRKSHEGLRS